MPRKVTIDDMVGAIRDAGRPCTKQDIADRTDVSRQTIANHADELEDDPRVEHGQVGPSMAYWIADGSGTDNEQPENPPIERRGSDMSHDDVDEAFGEEMREMLDEQESEATGNDIGAPLDSVSVQPDNPKGVVDRLLGFDRWLIGLSFAALLIFGAFGVVAIGSVLFNAPIELMLGLVLSVLLLGVAAGLAGAVFVFGVLMKYAPSPDPDSQTTEDIET